MSALASVRSSCPEVVLCDLGLPELSGYDFAKAIRRDCPRNIRLMAISGYAQPEDVQRSIEAGFDAHLAKPATQADVECWLAQVHGSMRISSDARPLGMSSRSM